MLWWSCRKALAAAQESEAIEIRSALQQEADGKELFKGELAESRQMQDSISERRKQRKRKFKVAGQVAARAARVGMMRISPAPAGLATGAASAGPGGLTRGLTVAALAAAAQKQKEAKQQAASCSSTA